MRQHLVSPTILAEIAASLHLFLGRVVVLAAHALKVVDVPEQPLIASMRNHMVNHWTVRRWMLAGKQHARLPACVEIADQHLLPKLLPPG